MTLPLIDFLCAPTMRGALFSRMEKPSNSHRVKDGLSHAIETALENRLSILSADTAQLSGWA
jgi:hypothetical protein